MKGADVSDSRAPDPEQPALKESNICGAMMAGQHAPRAISFYLDTRAEG
jgi:hypothetical protein